MRLRVKVMARDEGEARQRAERVEYGDGLLSHDTVDGRGILLISDANARRDMNICPEIDASKIKYIRRCTAAA